MANIKIPCKRSVRTKPTIMVQAERIECLEKRLRCAGIVIGLQDEMIRRLQIEGKKL